MSFPIMTDAFWKMGKTLQFQTVVETVADYQVTETQSAATLFEGILQPLQVQKLLIKPEGERTWKWWALWTIQQLELNTTIQDQGKKQYRVVSGRDWSDAGYYEYELTEKPH